MADPDKWFDIYHSWPILKTSYSVYTMTKDAARARQRSVGIFRQKPKEPRHFTRCLTGIASRVSYLRNKFLLKPPHLFIICLTGSMHDPKNSAGGIQLHA